MGNCLTDSSNSNSTTSATTTSNNNSNMSSSSIITLGLGCYWGSQKYYAVDFGKKLFKDSILSAKVGFMGGDVKDPSYRQVCNGNTNHVEVVQLVYDNTKCNVEDIIKFFYCIHDPTTMNQQANDCGTQYASVIFTHSDEQKEIAKSVTAKLQTSFDESKINFSKQYKNKKIVTRIENAAEFYEAQEDHQDYLFKNPNGYCSHTYHIKFEDMKL